MSQIKQGHVEAGGVRYGYEIHGAGAPLLLLHGGFGTLEMFGPGLASLAARRQVIAVDLYGHGRTALTDRPIDPVAIGDDMATLVRALGFERVDVLGFSFGGMVAFRLAVQHPEVVDKLVLVSVPYAETGFYADIREQQKAVNREGAAMLMQTPLYEAYKAVAPRVEDFPEFVTRMGEAIRRPYDWSEDARGPEAHDPAGLRRQRHVRTGTHRALLSAARRGVARRGLGRRRHGAPSAGDPAGGHSLRDVRGSGPGRYGAGLPRRR